MKLNIWVEYFPNFLLHRGTIFGPIKTPNRLTNWMCRRRFRKAYFVANQVGRLRCTFVHIPNCLPSKYIRHVTIFDALIHIKLGEKTPSNSEVSP